MSPMSRKFDAPGIGIKGGEFNAGPRSSSEIGDAIGMNRRSNFGYPEILSDENMIAPFKVIDHTSNEILEWSEVGAMPLRDCLTIFH
jgi:hypothetical protein